MLDEVNAANQSLEPFRVGEFVFEPSTGLVRPVEAPASHDATRLPPKPAALLLLLIEAEGEVVGHEAIREALWPDVHVDFDQNLRFCVRQVRSAFGDSARDPRYVGTVPKRGYRLLAEASRGLAPPAEEEAPTTTAGTVPRWVWLLGAALLWVAVVDLGLWHLDRGRGTGRPLRLAVVPFELAGEGQRSEDLARLGEWLLAELVEGRTEAIEVVGPRTTVRFAAFPFPDLQALEDELDIDYVLNARPLAAGDEHDLIVELIRLSNGAHPFARYYDDEQPWSEIAADVLQEVERALDLPEPSEPSTAD